MVKHTDENIVHTSISDLIENIRYAPKETAKHPTGGLKPIIGRNIPTITESFDGVSVFITGGTGFMGKVLIEKLLRSCPGIVKIYLLLRNKKGVREADRLKNIIDTPVFDKLRDTKPETFSKLAVISGDASEIRLGISNEDEILLTSTVSVVFHAAASVRFDEPLKSALLMNTRGAREVVMLARKMKNLKVLVHVSTTYCNTDRPVIDEIVYPPKANWQHLLKMTEVMSEEEINLLCEKIIYPMPNTYTFSKALAEDIINDYSRSLPVLIYRPSIVVPTLHEPMPGWVDNFNGTTGIVTATQSGILRTLYGDSNIIAEYIPADMAIKTMISATWYRMVQKEYLDKKCLVINAATSSKKPISYKCIMQKGMELGLDIPLKRILWHPFLIFTTTRTVYIISFILFQLLPALFLDVFLKFSGSKMRLIKLYRKIFVANEALYYFLSNRWTFVAENFESLDNILLEPDVESFKINVLSQDPLDAFKANLMGMKLYLLKEDPDMERNLKESRRNSARLKALHYFTCFMLAVLFIWLCWPMFTIVTNKACNKLQSFIYS